MRDAIALLALLDNPNVRAFWHVIRVGEGTADEDGYRRMFGGELFESFADHPRRAITRSLGGRPITSTAAGAGQFLARTWDECEAALGLGDFSPANQDIAALYLIDRRKALDDVLAGRVEDAIRKCNREWASLPESPYGQPTRTLAQALATYDKAGGARTAQGAPPGASLPTSQPIADRVTAVDPASQPEQPMPIPAIIGALLPSFIEAIPKLGKLFGSGSEVAERNIKAAEIAVDIVKQATGARNAQEAAEMVASDPAAAQAARQAVESRWFELVESGGGGIDGARKADLAIVQAEGAWWQFIRSPSFWALLLLVPLVYLLVGSLIGLWGTATWSDDVRAGLSGSIISAIIGGAVGYYWGQTTSRNRAPAG